jgi:hypothetical protein
VAPILSAKRLIESAHAPTSLKRLKMALGRAGLLDSAKYRLLLANREEISLVGEQVMGWIVVAGGKVLTDSRARPIIRLTPAALSSWREAVITVGHELNTFGICTPGQCPPRKLMGAASKILDVGSQGLCPSCGEAMLRFYCHKFPQDPGRGTIWIWCYACAIWGHVSRLKLPFDFMDPFVEMPGKAFRLMEKRNWIERLNQLWEKGKLPKELPGAVGEPPAPSRGGR